MKIYEYAKKRNIKSRVIVKKLHDLGYIHVKNHLSLVPIKIIDELDSMSFEKGNAAKPKVKVCFISMECAPFSSSGLGDMVYNKVLQGKLNGNDNIVIIPKYHFDDMILEPVMDIEISIRHRQKAGKVYKTIYENTPFYLVDSDYFKREMMYGYVDDAERFAFLAKASIILLQKLNIAFDIINIHDWPLGLYPLLYRDTIKGEYPNTIVEFSVYGATYQGIYDVGVLIDVFNLDKKYFDDVEYAKSVNFLKAGLVTADRIDINKVALDDLKNSYLREFVYDNM